MDDIKKQLEEIKSEQQEHGKILSSVDKTLALQAQQLEYHIKRTDIAEENIGLLRAETKTNIDFIHKEIKPLLTRYLIVDGFIRVAAIVATIIGASYYGLQIIKFFAGL